MDDVTRRAATTTAFFSRAVKGLVSVLGSMLIMYTVTTLIQGAAEAWENYTKRLENTKESLKNTEDQLDSIESEIKSTTEQIKNLQALDPSSLSITNQEDLDRLRAQNEELRIRQQYLEMQKQEDKRQIVEYAKERYNKKYSTETTREGIDEYKGYINKEKTSNSYTGYDLSKSPNISLNSDAVSNETDTITILLATYEDLAEKKKEAIASGDAEGIAEYDRKILDTVSSLNSCRTELQGFKDDIYATGESSDELNDINHKIEMIDKALLTPGKNLINFLDSDELSEDKKKLGELAEKGELTQDVLEESFSQVNDYLKDNGLTIQDLISIFGLYKNELESIGVFPSEKTGLSVSATIDELNSKLKPAIDSIGEAYTNIFTEDGFTRENIDLDMFSSIKSELDELLESGVNISYAPFENFVNVLNNTKSSAEDIQNAFNQLSTSITNVALSGAEDFNTLQNALSDLGIQNSDIIAFQALAQNKEALVESGLDLKNATKEEIDAFAAEYVSAENLTQAITMLKIQKILCNDNWLDNTDDIEAMYSLAKAAGIATGALGELLNFQTIYNDAVANGNTTAAAAAQHKINDLKKQIDQEFASLGKFEVDIDFSPKSSSGSGSKEAEKEVDIMAELNAEMDEYQSKLEAVKTARETYNEHGKITVDQAQEILDADFKLLAAYGAEEEALNRLGQTKLNEMQIQLARNAIDTINNITSEAMATEYLAGANEHLANSTLDATEAMLQQAVASAKVRGELQGQAAETILKGYQNGAMMLGQVDFGFNLEEAEKVKEDEKTLLDIFNEERRYLEHLQKMDKINNKEFYERLEKLAEKYLSGNDEYKEEKWGVEEEIYEYYESIKKEYNWIENLLESISKKVNSLISKAEKFYSWQKKNLMINRVVRETDKEITQNQNAYNFYMTKANSVGLGKGYIDKIQNGKLSIEEIADEELSEKIEKYEEWYKKAQDVKDTIEELYDQERELIRQKLDNVIEYYNDIDSYLSSITSKVESLINLNEQMGKKSSLTELVQQFSDVSAQLSALTSASSEIKSSITEINFGESQSVKDAVEKDKQKQIATLQAEIDNLLSENTGTYQKLLKDIEKKEKQIANYEAKGWDQTKVKKYEQLWSELDAYYDLQAELDANATSNTIKNYTKVYKAWKKLQDKIDSGKDLNKNQQKRYDALWQQLDSMIVDGYNEVDALKHQLGVLNGTIAPETEAEKAQKEYDSVQENLSSTATYKNLENNIAKTEDKIAKLLDGKEYDELTKKQKKTYDNLTATLEKYYDRKKALDENATADNIVQYNKIYVAWKKLQDRLDSGKNLTEDQWKNYEKYTKQLESFSTSKYELMSDLENQLAEAMNPSDKLDTIEREYEEAAEGIYNSYQKQIDGVKSSVEETKQYQNLLAKARKLETKKDNKGLTKAEENTLNKYYEKLEALRTGATTENIKDYMSTWEKMYQLEKKIKKDGKLSASDAKDYDTYKAKLEAWNKEKQTQISDLVSLMEDELESLQKTYVENVSEAESQISEYYANLYDLARQITEYNLSNLEEQLSLLDSYISYYQEIVDLYNRFSDDKLSKLLTDLDIDVADSQESLYAEYLSSLEKKYDATLSKINEYKELIGALEDTNDFGESMQLFQKALEQYRADGQDDMANKLQSVLDLLNERANDADNWGEYSDVWLNEWNTALAEAKTELIGIAGSIQDVNDQLREIRFSNITDSIKELSNAQDILSSITGIIKDEWMFNKDGNLTQYGLTKVGLLVEQMNQANNETSKYAQLIESIESMKDTYASTSAYEDALHEAKMNYLSSISDLQNYQDSIVAIITKADEAVINSLKDVIEKRKEALQKKKELYDYDKSIKSSQKEIDAIKAQISALESLSDKTDAATKAKLAQLKADLSDKEEELQQTKDEHTYDLQMDALDELLKSLDETTDEINSTLESYIEAINSALKIYDDNNSFLDKWSNDIISTITKMGEFDSKSYTDLKIDSGNTDNLDTNNISLNVVNSDTGSPIELIKEATQESINNLQEIVQSAINDGLLVRVDPQSLITTSDVRMFNFMSSQIPNINSMLRNIQAKASNNTVSSNVNIHYDNLMYVEGNIDKDFSQVLPDYLKKACEYTKNDIYKELNRTN